MSKSIILCLVFTMLISCYYDNEEELYGNDTCDTKDVSYSKDIKPIVDQSCAIIGCHVQGGSGPGLLENYSNTKDMVDRGSFERRVIVQMDMPPSSVLSDCQLEHITEWIAQGAPDN